MKPSAFRIERLLAKVEAEVARRGLRARRYAFHPDEVAEAEAQGLPYALVPRVLSKQEWLERYATPGAEAEFYARFSGGPVAFTRPGQPPKPSAPGPQQVKPRPPAARGKAGEAWIGVMTTRPHHKIEDLSDEQINHTRLGVAKPTD